MKERRLIAEWWELRWEKPGKPAEIVHSGWPAHGLRPAGTFGSAEDARDCSSMHDCNRYHRIVRVRRYAVKKVAA